MRTGTSVGGGEGLGADFDFLGRPGDGEFIGDSGEQMIALRVAPEHEVVRGDVFVGDFRVVAGWGRRRGIVCASGRWHGPSRWRPIGRLFHSTGRRWGGP